jgi:hypothetical protein
MRLIDRAIQDGDADAGITQSFSPKLFEPGLNYCAQGILLSGRR